MKTTKWTAFFLTALIGLSCSDNDENEQPAIENASLSFTSEQQIVTVPNAMLTSDDTYAQMATAWVTMANSMTASVSMFTPPPSATKSTERINASNSRVKSGSTVVYTWSDPQYGSVAYQISDASSKYTFELFFKEVGQTEWLRYLYAEEKKDKSSGYMELYNAFDQSTASDPLMRWNWERSGDNFQLTFTSSSSEFYFILAINTSTKAGSIIYFEGTEKTHEMIWDAQGNGSWKSFVEGEEFDQGSW